MGAPKTFEEGRGLNGLEMAVNETFTYFDPNEKCLACIHKPYNRR